MKASNILAAIGVIGWILFGFACLPKQATKQQKPQEKVIWVIPESYHLTSKNPMCF